LVLERKGLPRRHRRPLPKLRRKARNRSLRRQLPTARRKVPKRSRKQLQQTSRELPTRSRRRLQLTSRALLIKSLSRRLPLLRKSRLWFMWAEADVTQVKLRVHQWRIVCPSSLTCFTRCQQPVKRFCRHSLCFVFCLLLSSQEALLCRWGWFSRSTVSTFTILGGSHATAFARVAGNADKWLSGC
jgi:hypothetical protein